jgi:hypothetical protein
VGEAPRDRVGSLTLLFQAWTILRVGFALASNPAVAVVQGEGKRRTMEECLGPAREPRDTGPPRSGGSRAGSESPNLGEIARSVSWGAGVIVASREDVRRAGSSGSASARCPRQAEVVGCCEVSSRPVEDTLAGPMSRHPS